MKAIRITLAVLGGLLVVLVVAAVIIISRFDPNAYKDEITAFVQERTGRTLTIDEDIELSLFPWFAVETGGVAMTDDPRFGDRSFITVDVLSARVRVWPLLRREVEIGKVVLDGIVLNLGLDQDGLSNWESLLPEASDAEPASEPATADAARPAFDELAVEGIELRNARILWHAPDGEVVYIARDFDLESGPIRNDEPVDVTLGLSLLEVGSQTTAEISLSTVASYAPIRELRDIELGVRILDDREAERATAAITLGSITFENGRIRTAPMVLSALLTRPPVGPESLEVSARLAGVEVDTMTEQLVVNGLRTEFGALAADWNLTGEAILSEPRLNGSLALGGARIGDLLDLLGVAAPASIDPDTLGTVAGDASIRMALAPLTVTVDSFDFSALGVRALGNASLTENNELRGHVELPSFAPSPLLRELLEASLPEGVDTNAIDRASLSADFAAASDGGALELSALTAEIDALRLTGSIRMAGTQDAPRISGSLTGTGLDDELLGALFGTWIPAELLAADLGSFRLATGFDLTPAESLAVFEPLELTAYGVTGVGQLTIVTSGDALSLQGQARLEPFSPRALLARFDLPVPQTSDAGVLASAEIATSFETNATSGRFRDITIELDDSRITGEFSVENFADPSYRFVLRADRLDVDKYLPPRAEEPASGDDPERRLGDMRLSSDALTSTAVSGTVNVGNLVIGGMRFEQLTTNLAVGRGRLELGGVSTRLYGGEFSGQFVVDASVEVPTARLAGVASGLTMRPLLDDLIGQSPMAGTGSFDLDLNGRGETINDVLRTANGRMSVALLDGQIDGFNLDWTFCSAFNSADRLALPDAAPKLTRFSELRTEATVQDGIASTQNLYARTEHFENTGPGRISLAEARVDFDLRASLVAPIELARCERINTQVGKSFPYNLNGVLPDVIPKPDISAYLGDRARDTIQDAARDRLQDAIRGLFD